MQGIGMEGVWCKGCISKEIPFVGLVSESEFRGALREYKEGLGSNVGDFQDLRLDPFDEEVQGALGYIKDTLQGCAYIRRDEVGGSLKRFAKGGGCSLSLLSHNIRSAKGPSLELLETEMRGWGVQWDIVGLSETWLDAESEGRISVQGFSILCASRKKKSGGVLL